MNKTMRGITTRFLSFDKALPGILYLLILLLAGGCAHTGNPDDPLEPFNRKVQTFNDTVDRFTLKPVAKAYTYVFPDFFRQLVNNAFSNLAYPVVFVNQFLQGKVDKGFSDVARFVVNSTLGVAGLFDVAGPIGLPEHEEDFGQTFAVWGWENPPYLVAPFFGPTTLRDGIGEIAGLYTYPPFYIDDDTARWSMFGAAAVVERARRLEQEKLIVGDRYIFIRDAFLQRRQYLIEDGKEQADPFLND